MCQFCHQHGEGKKWYLKVENYAQELLSDMNRRRFIADFVRTTAGGHVSEVREGLEKAMTVPERLRKLVFSRQEKKFQKDHFGQVVPIEEVEEVLNLSNSVVRMPCICRKNTTGRTDNSFCFGLGIDPEKLLDIKEAFLETFRPGPEVNLFERLTVAEALDLHRAYEKKGLIHTIWTFKTPFIGGLCNCDRSECLAMVSREYDFQLFFRAEYVAGINEQSCTGCGACAPLCQFEAIRYSSADGKSFIDPLRCFGCGVCRSVCEFDAIELTPRNEHPVSSKIW